MGDPGIRLAPVRSKAELERFIRLPNRLNGGDPNYVAPLRMERREALSPRHNPFFGHADVAMWLAVRGGRDVGRISAQIDHLAPQEPARPAGAFGLIAAEDDPAVFAALFAEAEAWLRARGMAAAIGPLNLSVNEEVGLLVDGFDTAPMIMMGHDPRHTAGRIEEQGYAKAKDLYAYRSPVAGHAMPAALLRLGSAASGVVLRQLDMRRYREEVRRLTEILNDAWRDNWGFTPTTEAETAHLANALRPLVDPRLVWFAEIDGEAAAVIVVLPNLNEAIAGLGGKLLPFGWARLLWRLKVRGVKTLRVPLMGVRKAHSRTPRGRLLPFRLVAAAAGEAAKLGYETVEFSWILEENTAMRRICEAAGAKVCKTYRIYGKALA